MADEVRLIDANALRLMKVEECAGHTIEFASGWKACVEYCKNDAPTIEAEPVKHGRWELISQNKFTGTKTLRCTYCKNYFVVQDDTLNAGRGDANFCPNCGSKNRMDGDSDDKP